MQHVQLKREKSKYGYEKERFTSNRKLDTVQFWSPSLQTPDVCGQQRSSGFSPENSPLNRK